MGTVVAGPVRREERRGNGRMDGGSGQMFVALSFSLIGGLGIFLLGMKHMSEGMQAVAGVRLRKLISAVTDNRFTACGVGVLVTTLIQSSSVTTVMVVGFVNSGFMTLTQAIGVILGANIGTTITGWILVLKIGKYGLPMLGVAAFVYLFSNRERVRYTAMVIMGIGMVFFGLQMMSDGFKPLRAMPEFLDWFQRFRADDYFGVLKCAAVGCVLTMIVQSSSATLGITMGMATAGLIDFPAAAALVLGENIGTTITAYLASLGATTDAKRAAYSHMIFNVVGVVWITALFRPYMALISMIVGMDPGGMVLEQGVETFTHMRQGIALVHTGFNVANTLLFLPMVPLLAQVVRRLAPQRARKETPHLTYLDVRMVESPAIGIQQSYVEVMRMGAGVHKMLGWVKLCLTEAEPDEKREQKIFHREEVMDVVQGEITEFLSHLLAGTVTHTVMDAGRMHLRMADEYESVSDYVVSVIKLVVKLRNAGLSLRDESKKDLLDLHDHVAAYVDLVNEGVQEGRRELVSKARTQGDAITHLVKECRQRYLAAVCNEPTAPLATLIFSDMLNSYRRIKDHALNIAEALAGEK